MGRFHLSSDEEIKNGKTTDVYFMRTKEILSLKGVGEVNVVMEASAGALPNSWPWAVLCGIDEIAYLFEGLPVNIYSFNEGTIFRQSDMNGIRVPVLSIEGDYKNFCHLETPLLGLICHSSGIATKAARVRKAASEKMVISFGIRRAHPGLSRMIDRAAYIGGLDGVSSLSGADTIGKEPIGTMPHSLIISFDSQIKAWKAFDETMPQDIPRIALVDTYNDEKTEAILAAESFKGKLHGVRLDTPTSRRGDFSELIREVRWELNVKGYEKVKIYVSGGLNENNIKELSNAGADGFGVGTAISNAPTVDFALDIVEKNGKPNAKRGKFSGRKQVWRCHKCMSDKVSLANNQVSNCYVCGEATDPMLKPLIRNGKIVRELPKPEQIRQYVLKQLEQFSL
jgi:nicotinate phosphoribosyltransferase